jgi:hypothetical protein
MALDFSQTLLHLQIIIIIIIIKELTKVSWAISAGIAQSV